MPKLSAQFTTARRPWKRMVADAAVSSVRAVNQGKRGRLGPTLASDRQPDRRTDGHSFGVRTSSSEQNFRVLAQSPGRQPVTWESVREQWADLYNAILLCNLPEAAPWWPSRALKRVDFRKFRSFLSELHGSDLQRYGQHNNRSKFVSKRYRKVLDTDAFRPVYSEPRPPVVTKSLRPVSSVYRRTQMPRKGTQASGFPSCLRRRGRQDALARRFSRSPDDVGR